MARKNITKRDKRADNVFTKCSEGETKKEAVTLLAEYKKLTGDTSGPVNAAGADGALQRPQAEYEPPSRNREYSVIELRIDSLLS